MERDNRPITKRMFLRGSAVLLGASLPFVLDPKTKQTNAQNSEATKTPTPDALATQVAKAQQDLAKERQAASQRATLTAVAEQIDIFRRGTRTPMPTPRPADTATTGPKINEVVVAIETVVRGRLSEKETATALVQRQTPVLTQTPRPTGITTERARHDGGSLPWGWVLSALVGGGSVFAWYHRAQIPGWVAAGQNWIRARFPGGGGAPAAGGGAAGGAAGGAGAPPAGGAAP